MKIFITGATGFIGRHLVNRLVSEGNKVTVNMYGNDMTEFEDSVKMYRSGMNVNDDIDFISGQSFDGVIHLASLYITDHKPENVVDLINSNIAFGSYIIECASKAKIKWFINTGTFWQHYQNKDYSPVNLYSATKQAFESIAKYYSETEKIKFVTLQLCDTYGPDDPRPKIFSLWERISKTGESLDMSPGEQLIDISYIDDITCAFTLLAKHLNEEGIVIENGSVFAVKALRRYTLKELAWIFEKASGRKLNIRWNGKPYREREVMVPWEKGVIVPGWQPCVPIEEGIRRMIKI